MTISKLRHIQGMQHYGILQKRFKSNYNLSSTMQEHTRALIVIIVLAMIGFSIAKKLAPIGILPIDSKQWTISWFVVLILAFTVGNFWIYSILSGMFISIYSVKSVNKMAIFFILLYVIPPLEITVPGLGLVNYLFVLSHPRFIILVILLPAALSIASKNNFRFTSIWADKFLLLYILLIVVLELRNTSFTDTLRAGFNNFIDIFLPYYVASRSLKNLQQFKVVAYAFVTLAIVISIIAVFESGKSWLLFSALGTALETGDPYGNYLGRAGSLRAISSLGHPIALGYFVTIAIGFFLFLSPSIERKLIKRLGGLILALGLYVPLSRGPWVGAFAMIIVFILLSSKSVKKLSSLLLAGALVLPLIAILPGGDKFINLIPFFGNTETGNIEYREQLFENSVIVIKRNLLFGSVDFLQTPEMQAMKQGEGIIDVVNTYLSIALYAGIAGLTLFISVFVATLIGIRGRLKRVVDKSSESHLLGRCLIAMIISILITIATVASVGTVAITYWAIVGIGVAYTKMEEQKILSSTTDSVVKI